MLRASCCVVVALCLAGCDRPSHSRHEGPVAKTGSAAGRAAKSISPAPGPRGPAPAVDETFLASLEVRLVFSERHASPSGGRVSRRLRKTGFTNCTKVTYAEFQKGTGVAPTPKLHRRVKPWLASYLAARKVKVPDFEELYGYVLLHNLPAGEAKALDTGFNAMLISGDWRRWEYEVVRDPGLEGKQVLIFLIRTAP